MKKLFITITSILIFSSVNIGVINAQQLTMPQTYGCVNDTVLIPVNFSNILSVAALTLFISYDTAVMKFAGVANISTLTPGLACGVPLSGPNAWKAVIAWDALTSADLVSGKLCDIKFKYKGGSSNLTFLPSSELVSIDLNEIIVSYTNGGIVSPITTQPAPAQICEGGLTGFSVTAASGSTYQWQVKNGAQWNDLQNNTIYSGVNNSSLQILQALYALNNNLYRCVVTKTCSQPSGSALLTVNPLPVAAGTITGSASVCKGQNAVSYSVSSVTNATSYIWTLPAGASGSSTNSSILVNFNSNAVSGDITVKGHNTCGDGIVASFAVTVNSVPLTPGAITGINTVCKGQNSVAYSIVPVSNATSYIWTLPTGASGISTSNSISVNYASNAVSGNITVKGHNDCGDGANTSLTVTVNSVPLAAGAITGATTVYRGQNSVLYSVPPVTDATSYIWTLPAGASGTSSTASITVNYEQSAVSGDITVAGHNDCGDGTASALTVTVANHQWTGAASTEWGNSGNWNFGVPVSATDITIPAAAPRMPEIGDAAGITLYDAGCRDLTIETGAMITIQPGSSLTISGDALLNGNNSVIVVSNVHGSGTLITKAGVSGAGSAQIQRYITGNQWHLISSPVSGSLSSVFIRAWLKDYSEAANAWNIPNISVTQPLNTGKGFAVWDTTTGGRVISFTGLPNTGSVTPDPAITFSGITNGFNLVGNPYPSAIDWDHPAWVKTNVDATVYTWNGANYVNWNGSIGGLTDGVIPADQGFFVHTNAAFPALQIPNTSRCLSAQAFYKSLPSDLLVLKATGNGYQDETYINFNINATNTFDKEFDGYKLWGRGDAPQLYTYDADQIYSINVMPSLILPLTVSVGFRTGVSGNYTITASELNSFDQNTLITLEDQKTSQVTDLRQNPVYHFTAASSDDSKRFLIHFGSSTTGIENKGANEMVIYSYESAIFINSNGTEGTVCIYDMLGQQITSEKLKPGAVNKLRVNISGYYMVKVVTGRSVILRKVFCII